MKRNRNDQWKASFTIEASYVVAAILMIFFMVIVLELHLTAGQISYYDQLGVAELGERKQAYSDALDTHWIWKNADAYKDSSMNLWKTEEAARLRDCLKANVNLEDIINGEEDTDESESDSDD